MKCILGQGKTQVNLYMHEKRLFSGYAAKSLLNYFYFTEGETQHEYYEETGHAHD